MQPPAYPGRDTWHLVAARHNQRVARNGTLAEIHLAQIAAALPGGGNGAPVDATGKPDEERFSLRLRVVVTAHGGHIEGLQGVSQKQVFVHDDSDLVRGFPTRLAGAGSSQPVFANLDGKPGDEMIVATDDGFVHAYNSRGRDIRGWPVRTMDAPWWPFNSPTARFERIRPPGSASSFGAPVVADLDGDGQVEVVVTDTDGNVWAWQADGHRRSGFTPVMVDGHLRSATHVNFAFSTDSTATQDEFNRTKCGFAGSPAVADLDGDGRLDIVAAALDRHVYAFHDNGTPVAGFPVLAVDPAKVQSVDPVSHKVTFLPESGVRQGGELFATPTLVDLTGDGRPEIVVGAQEEYQEAPNIGDGASVLGLLQNVTDLGNTRLYAISSHGTNATFPERSAAHPDDQAYVPGWPVALGQLGLEVLPTIGDGVATQVAAGDVNPHPGVEVIAASAAGPPYVLDAQGKSVYGQVNGKDVPAAWTAGLLGETASRFGAQRNSNDIITAAPAFTGFSIGQLDGDATRPEFAAPTLGFSRLLDIQASDLQLPNDDQVMGWNGTTGNALPGFPQVSSDMAFFVTPAIADLAGNGVNDVISGNGVYMLNAFDQHGNRPAGWPKLTGGWLVGTPGLGDWNGDGKAEIATVRRDGVLMVWHTNAPASSLTEWSRYGGNNRNTGVYHDR
jgi:FG-GAP-like repeat